MSSWSPATPASAACRFVLGFKTLHDAIPNTAGQCLDDESHNPENGDGLQHTTAWHGKGGLLVWRKADNWTAFTDGNRTWINGPFGIQERSNAERFAWEGVPPAAATGPAPAPSAPPPTATPTPQPRATGLGLPFAGVYLTGHDPNALGRARDVGADVVTIQFNWEALEPTQSGTLAPGPTAALDTMVSAALARGVTPIALVGGAPKWAAPQGPGALYRDKDAAYLKFVDNLVAHYAARGVRHWMLWPEPDAVQNPPREPDRGGWGDEPEWFGDVVKRAALTIRARDPNAKVVLGPLAHDRFFPPRSAAWCPIPYPAFHYNCGGIFSYEFLDRAFSVPGLAAAIDAVALNGYAYYGAAWETGQNGVDVGAKIRHVRGRLNALGVNLPIVVGESGVWSSGPPGADLPHRVPGDIHWRSLTPQLQAEYAAKLLARARDAGAPSLIWFTLEEIDPQVKYGLLDEQGRQKPASATFRRAAGLLRDATPVVADWLQPVAGQLERYAFRVATGRVALAWAVGAEVPTGRVSLPAGTRATDVNGGPVGQAAVAADGRLLFDLTGAPVYFERPD